jgi:DNA-binding XRE family transcriptional regulator
MKLKISTRKQLRTQLFEDVNNGTISLNEALKIARKVLNKNQAEYANLVGVSKKVIADFEVNKGNPTLATINKLFSPVGLVVGLKNRNQK